MLGGCGEERVGGKAPPAGWAVCRPTAAGLRLHCPFGAAVVLRHGDPRLLRVVGAEESEQHMRFWGLGVRGHRTTQETRHYLWLVPCSSQAPVTLI